MINDKDILNLISLYIYVLYFLISLHRKVSKLVSNIQIKLKKNEE